MDSNFEIMKKEILRQYECLSLFDAHRFIMGIIWTAGRFKLIAPEEVEELRCLNENTRAEIQNKLRKSKNK